jgi:hypothetical protein
MRGLSGKSPKEPKEVRIDSPNAVNIVTIFPMRSNKINHLSWSTLLLAKKAKLLWARSSQVPVTITYVARMARIDAPIQMITGESTKPREFQLLG